VLLAAADVDEALVDVAVLLASDVEPVVVLTAAELDELELPPESAFPASDPPPASGGIQIVQW
jgi:hypothetical protein